MMDKADEEEFREFEKAFEFGGNINEGDHTRATRVMVVAIGRLLFWYIRKRLEER